MSFEHRVKTNLKCDKCESGIYVEVWRKEGKVLACEVCGHELKIVRKIE